MKKWIKRILERLSLGYSSQSKDLTKIEFTRLYIESLKKIYPGVNFNIESELTIKANFDGNELAHYLDNPHKEYQLDKESLNLIISKYVASSADLYKEKEEIKINRIIPMIKPVDYLNDLEQLEGNNGDKELWIVYERYNDKLIIVFGEDTENSIKYFSREDFAKLNIDQDTLLNLAVNNLKSILPDIQLHGREGSFGLSAGGDFEASLILMKSLWSKENINVNGDFVIAIPNRDLLFITGSKNTKEVERIREIAIDSYRNGNHQVSPYLFIWKGERFEEHK